MVDNADNQIELRTFPTQRLRTFGLIPDVGLFELALNFGQAFRFAIIVKDTPSTRLCVR